MVPVWSGAVSFCAQVLSRVRLFLTSWTIARQAPLPMGILQARILEWVAMPSSNSLLFEPLGEPKNAEVDSLSLLQGIFLTQQLNWCLLHCRQILCSSATREALLYGGPIANLQDSRLMPLKKKVIIMFTLLGVMAVE